MQQPFPGQAQCMLTSSSSQVEAKVFFRLTAAMPGPPPAPPTPQTGDILTLLESEREARRLR